MGSLTSGGGSVGAILLSRGAPLFAPRVTPPTRPPGNARDQPLGLFLGVISNGSRFGQSSSLLRSVRS